MAQGSILLSRGPLLPATQTEMLFACWLLAALLCAGARAQRALSKSQGPPAFFLQDASDGLCLADGRFQRCGLDTLWFVVGKPGSYQVHQYSPDEDSELCLDKVQCHLEESDVSVANCNHCGAKKWNFVGDPQTGYVLTESDNKFCVKRVGAIASSVLCDKGYVTFNLQFATKDSIVAMRSEGARLIAAAADNDMSTVHTLLAGGVDINSRNWDNMTALIEAAGKGHIDMVKYLVKVGADVNLRDRYNSTALAEASLHGHLKIVQALVDVDAELDARTVSGASALWLASSGGHAGIVEVLLAKKCEAGVKRTDGISALMASCVGGHSDVVIQLLEAGAEVNTHDKDGLTALINAAENGSAPIAAMLVSRGADINAASSSGFSALIISSAHGHVDLTQFLLDKGANLEPDHPEGVTPLMYAAAGGHSDVVKLLLAKGAAVNKRHKQGGTALTEAATAGSVSALELLLSAGADPAVTDKDGVTSLMSAASQGHVDVCRVLLDRAVSVNAIASSGGTALMYAAGGGHLETVQLLLSRGADANIVVQAMPEYIEATARAISEGKEDVQPHVDGVTALSLAAQGGFLPTVQVLVEAGAQVDVADEDDMTPLTTAIKSKHTTVAEYLLEHGANGGDTYLDESGKLHNLLFDSVLASDTELSLLLIEKGANVSFSDADGATVVTQAAYTGLLRVVKSLLAAGCDPQHANDEGIDALIAASSEGHTEVVHVLLQSGKSSVNAHDKDGTTALMAAAVRGHKDVLVALLDHGADIDAQNADGHTALMFAFNGKSQVQTLLDKYSEFMDKDQSSAKIIQDALRTHLDVVELLTQRGADALLQDKEGRVAADFDHQPAPSTTVGAQGEL